MATSGGGRPPTGGTPIPHPPPAGRSPVALQDVSIYDQQEIDLLRRAIAGLAFLDDAAARSMSEAVAAGQCSPSLAPFWWLAASAPDLWRKLAQRLGEGIIGPFSQGFSETYA